MTVETFEPNRDRGGRYAEQNTRKPEPGLLLLQMATNPDGEFDVHAFHDAAESFEAWRGDNEGESRDTVVTEEQEALFADWLEEQRDANVDDYFTQPEPAFATAGPVAADARAWGSDTPF